MVRSEGNTRMSMTPPGIDPGTVRLVAQRLNNYANPGHVVCISWIIKCVISLMHGVTMEIIIYLRVVLQHNVRFDFK